ncbi:hypothetical protein MN032_14310 [Agromyces atrinae]|uniref:hypothetical protein n=1 Tax=Agromyces atrinae TaxID=592376 RepID=UPI001F567C3E|nr:hypothetical protein [Agromyces atrinae]MCI2958869.1 hypothetical protein [Agromyces atrinae]
MPAPDAFDVREFARTAQGRLRDEWSAAELGGVAPNDLRMIAFLLRIEGGTMAYLRNVLVTPMHKDARVTAFLVTWAFEKFWIADALGFVLDANGAAVPAATDAVDPRPSGRTRRGPVSRAVGSIVSGETLIAAHLASSLVSDAVVRAGYATLAASTPAVAALAARLSAVDERHARFFRSEVHRRLVASARAVSLAQRELRRETYPLGAADLSDDERRFFASRLAESGADALLEAELRDVGYLDAPTIDRVMSGLLRHPSP